MNKRNTCLPGDRFGKLVVLREVKSDTTKYRLIEVKCDCGTIKTVRLGNLFTGSTNSCGCIYRKDIVGKKFGILTVIEFDKTSKTGNTKWVCECDCGKYKSVSTDCLKYGYTYSCGCQTWTRDGISLRDMTGLRFGKLIVVGQTSDTSTRKWRCLCDCGNERIVATTYLSNGTAIQCLLCNRDRVSLIGKKFGSLTVVGFHGVINAISYWSCTCDCGKINCKKTLNTAKHCLVGRDNRVCTAGREKESNINWKGFGDISGSDWCHIKYSAESRDLELSITIEQVWDIFCKQDSICALSGQELQFGIHNKTASLDRIDSSNGYILDNVWWVHKDINLMKLSLSVEELLNWCNLVIYKDTSEYDLQYIKNKPIKNWKGCGLISGSYLDQITRGAKSRDIEFIITIKDMWDKFVNQNGRCAITNLPLIFAKNHKDKINQTASLDRIDSSKEYSKDNIRWVHKQINRMKWDFSDEYFLNNCKKIIEYNEVKNERNFSR